MSKSWAFRADVLEGTASSLIGHDVEALDGGIGEVTEESVDVGSSYIVVDTGFWILDQKRLVPAAAIRGVDEKSSTVYLDMTKDEIKNAPGYVAESNVDDDPNYREAHDIYYRPYFGTRA